MKVLLLFHLQSNILMFRIIKILDRFPDLDEIWKIREGKIDEVIKKEFITVFDKQDYKVNKYGDGILAFMIMENLLTRDDYSMFDVKCSVTEYTSRYTKFAHFGKLYSYGQNNYLNFQGLRIVNSFGIRRLYTKNLIKYESLEVQQEFIKEVFRLPQEEITENEVYDKGSIRKLINDLTKLLKTLEEYQINFYASSIMIYYSSYAKELKLKFLDFSYFPQKLKFGDIKGIIVFIDILNKMLND